MPGTSWTRPPAAAALLAIGLHRVGYGFLTLMTLLLYRNTFDSWGAFFPAGLVGLGEVLAAGAVGTLLAAGVTPWVVRRIGKPRWIAALLVIGGRARRSPSVCRSCRRRRCSRACVIGFVGQAVKICVDSTLQESVDDDFRGRVFSVYDTLFNVTFVVAAAGRRPSCCRRPGSPTPCCVAVGRGLPAAAAAAYAHLTRRH